MKVLLTGLVLLASVSAEASSIRAALLVRTERPAGDLTEIAYDRVYGETGSLERGTDTTATEGYDFYCKIIGEDTLSLVAYRAGTNEVVKAELVSLREAEGSMTLERGRLIFSCYLVD
jgi:hypothetical protein